MTTISLQKKLIQKISEIDNVSILQSIEHLIQEEEKPRKLSDLQKKMISQSINQFNNGEFVEHDFLMDKLSLKYGF